MAIYAVTGAAGFIGSHLVDALLADGHVVRGLDNLSSGSQDNLDPRCALTIGDVADRDAVQKVMNGADGCFHLAAIASVARTNMDWSDGHRTNMGGTVAVLEAARDAGQIPVIYASSAAVYGDVSGEVAREDMVPRPRSPYGVDKFGSELQAGAAWHVHGVPNFGLRFFNVYGARQNPFSPYSGVISIFARHVAEGVPVTVHGDGRQVRDFIHVSDVVRHLTAAMRRVAARPGAAVANVCTGRGTSLLELLDILGTIHRREPVVSFGPARPGDIRQSIGDPSLAGTLLGQHAAVPLRTGLAALAELSRIAA